MSFWVEQLAHPLRIPFLRTDCFLNSIDLKTRFKLNELGGYGGHLLGGCIAGIDPQREGNCRKKPSDHVGPIKNVIHRSADAFGETQNVFTP